MKRIETITKVLLTPKQTEDYISDMTFNNKKIETYFCFGSAGTGKTSLARHYADKLQKGYYITGSERDSFANYNGEKIIIMDELRSDSMSYSELLKILDPYNLKASAGSRYYDKTLLADTFIITTPYSPAEFYSSFKSAQDIFILETSNGSVNDVTLLDADSPKQLYRRITPLKFTEDSVIPLLWDDEQGKYLELNNAKKPNLWFKNGAFSTKQDMEDKMKILFN